MQHLNLICPAKIALRAKTSPDGTFPDQKGARLILCAVSPADPTSACFQLRFFGFLQVLRVCFFFCFPLLLGIFFQHLFGLGFVHPL